MVCADWFHLFVSFRLQALFSLAWERVDRILSIISISVDVGFRIPPLSCAASVTPVHLFSLSLFLLFAMSTGPIDSKDLKKMKVRPTAPPELWHRVLQAHLLC